MNIPTPFPVHPPVSDDEMTSNLRQYLKQMKRELFQELKKALTVNMDATDSLEKVWLDAFPQQACNGDLNAVFLWVEDVLSLMVDSVSYFGLLGPKKKAMTRLCTQLHTFILALPSIIFSNITLINLLSFSEKLELMCFLSFKAVSLFFPSEIPQMWKDKFFLQNSLTQKYPYTRAYWANKWHSKLYSLVIKAEDGDAISLYRAILEQYNKPILALQDHYNFYKLVHTET